MLTFKVDTGFYLHDLDIDKEQILNAFITLIETDKAGQVLDLTKDLIKELLKLDNELVKVELGGIKTILELHLGHIPVKPDLITPDRITDLKVCIGHKQRLIK
jgi:hypothetical protein